MINEENKETLINQKEIQKSKTKRETCGSKQKRAVKGKLGKKLKHTKRQVRTF
jgi:hypothetical protein